MAKTNDKKFTKFTINCNEITVTKIRSSSKHPHTRTHTNHLTTAAIATTMNGKIKPKRTLANEKLIKFE